MQARRAAISRQVIDCDRRFSDMVFIPFLGREMAPTQLILTVIRPFSKMRNPTNRGGFRTQLRVNETVGKVMKEHRNTSSIFSDVWLRHFQITAHQSVGTLVLIPRRLAASRTSVSFASFLPPWFVLSDDQGWLSAEGVKVSMRIARAPRLACQCHLEGVCCSELATVRAKTRSGPSVSFDSGELPRTDIACSSVAVTWTPESRARVR